MIILNLMRNAVLDSWNVIKIFYRMLNTNIILILAFLFIFIPLLVLSFKIFLIYLLFLVGITFLIALLGEIIAPYLVERYLFRRPPSNLPQTSA